MHINHPSAFCVAVLYTHKNNDFYDFSTSARPHHNLLFMLDGTAQIKTADKELTVKAGDILYIPKGSTYSAKWNATPRCLYHTVHFNLLQQDEPFLNRKVEVQFIKDCDFNFLYSLVKDINANQDLTSPDRFKALFSFYKLCAEIFPRVESDNAEIKPSQITPALNYLENNAVASVKIEDLANMCLLSPSRFFFVFKQQVGSSPIVYKNQLIIQRASQTLLFEKNKSIEEISNQYGFDTPIYFRRIFKKITGKTPTQYRKDGGFI